MRASRSSLLMECSVYREDAKTRRKTLFRISSRLRAFAVFISSDEIGVLLRRINAVRRPAHVEHENRPSALDGTQLFELFRLFQPGRRPGGEFQQKRPPVRVNAQMQMIRRRPSRRRIPRERDG